MQRINWIDWAKSIAIIMVVFGHIPENTNNFLIRYICTFHMPLFFFISGYLSKRQTNLSNNIKKYWHSLIIPYFIYNIIFYPYWLARYILDHEEGMSISNILAKPIAGVFLGQIETSYSCTVSGVTWFLIALFIMRVVVDFCNSYKNNIIMIIFASIIAIIIYISSEYYNVMNNLLVKGLTRCLPFYVLGHILNNAECYKGTKYSRHAATAIILYTTSIILFFLIPKDFFWQQIARSYSISLVAIFAVLSTCKLLNNYTSKELINVSTGTIVIMGLHWMFIGSINYCIEKTFKIEGGIHYEWYTACLLSIAIVIMIYPIILFTKRHLPIALGK